MPKYKTVTTNFQNTVYLGEDPVQARQAAVRTGFECTVLKNDVPILSWSPIGGWRGLVELKNAR